MKIAVIGAAIVLICFAVAIAKGSYLGQKYPELKNGIQDPVQASISEVLSLGEPDVLKGLDGRIIYIEPISQRGEWLNSTVFLNEHILSSGIQAKDQLLENPTFKWKVHYLRGSVIALESLSDRNFYISSIMDKPGSSDTEHGLIYFILPKMNFLYETGYPKGANKVMLTVYNYYYNNPTVANRNVSQLFFQFKFNNGQYLALHPDTRFGKLTQLSYTPLNWLIYIPKAVDEYTTIDTVDNTGHSTPVTWTYSATIGISNVYGQTITDSLEVSLSYEIGGAFGKATAGIKYGHTWSTQTTQTFQKSITKTLSTTIPAGKKLVVQQLTGRYGTYEVRADYFKFVDPLNKITYERSIG